MLVPLRVTDCFEAFSKPHNDVKKMGRLHNDIKERNLKTDSKLKSLHSTKHQSANQTSLQASLAQVFQKESDELFFFSHTALAIDAIFKMLVPLYK